MSQWKWKQKISEEIFNMKYNLHNENGVEEIFRSISQEIASCETINRDKIENEFYEEMISGKFIPAGRILANARPNSKMKNYNNCFTIAIDDSMDSIYNALKEDALISKMGGGVGFNISHLRPRDATISKGGESSGPISFLKVFDASAKTIHTGGGRRSAHIAIMNVDHPDIEEFIAVKQGDKNKALTQFNISVGITDAFIDCYKRDGDWDLKFNGKVYKTIKAKDLYNKLVQNAFMHNEPGIFNLDHVNNNSNAYYMYYIEQVNPCVTGDTLVAVADGRNTVSIKQLAEEGKDVLVYAKDNNGKTVIRMMRNPRITGYDQDIYEVLLDDGSKIKCTGNHKLRMKDGSYKEAINLLPNESLAVYSKWATTFEEVFPASTSKSQEYWMISDGKKNIFEHRFIYEQLTGKKIPKGSVIHHKNFHGLSNSIDNLQLMTKQEHDAYHDISGDKNPVRRFPECNWMNNPEAQQKMREKHHIGAKRSEQTKKNIGIKTFERCQNPEYKMKLSSTIKNSWIDKRDCYMEGVLSRTQEHLKEWQKLTDLECFIENNTVMVKRHCEHCGNEFSIQFGRREQAYCSYTCSMTEHNKKLAKVSKIKADENKLNLQNTVFNLFSKYVNDNKQIPNGQEFLSVLNKNNINDLRTVGLSYSYKTFIDNICEKFGINSVSAQAINKNTKNCKAMLAEKLIDNGMIYNHKIVSVTKIGTDTVYNGTVDEFHNFDIIFNKTTTLSGRDKYLSCNNLQCGEQALPVFGVCDLGAINFSKFVINAFTDNASVLWNELSSTIKAGIRFLDNVLSTTEYPLDKIQDRSLKERRIGLGFTGYADMLAKMRIKYGSQESIDFTEKLASFFRDESYKASIELAKEKGSFPVLDREKFVESGFCKRLPEQIRNDILQYGIRNICTMTVAPTGTTSLSLGNNCSSGIEPMFSLSYTRNYRTGKDEETTSEIVYDDAWLEYVEAFSNESNKNSSNQLAKIEVPEYFVTTVDIDAKPSIDIQAIWQKYIDASISKTLNLKPGTTFEEYKDLFLYAYDKGLKGFTSFNPEGSIKGILEYNIPKKENDQVNRQAAPKRPEELPCDIHQVSFSDKKFLVLVGKLDGSLYEIFVDDNSEGVVDVDHHKEGIIKKNGKGHYSLIVKNGSERVVVQNLAKSFDQTYGVLARFVSMALRHGTPLQFIVEQLQKSKHFTSFEKVVARVLKKYIKDGELAVGQVCPECGGTLEFREGCQMCPTCSWSKCS